MTVLDSKSPNLGGINRQTARNDRKKTAETIFGLSPEILSFGCGVRAVLSTVSGDLLDDVESCAVLAAQFLYETSYRF